MDWEKFLRKAKITKGRIQRLRNGRPICADTAEAKAAQYAYENYRMTGDLLLTYVGVSVDFRRADPIGRGQELARLEAVAHHLMAMRQELRDVEREYGTGL